MGTSTREAVCGIPQFDGVAGFQHWSFRVKMFLDSVGVLHTLTQDAPEAAAEKKKFEESDRKAKNHIVSFLANECLTTVCDKKTAKEMWKALENSFAKRSISTQNLVRKQLNRLKLRDGDSMRAHLLVFEDLIRQLKTAGAKIEEADLVILLFQTLPDTYDPLVTALENIPEEELSLEVVKQRLLAEELKRTERHEDSGEVKLAAFSGDKHRKPISKPMKFQGKCHKCGKRGHMKKDCRQKGGEANSADQRDQRTAVNFVASRKNEKFRSGKVVFKLDSGASDHLVNEAEIFSETRKLKEPIEIQVAKDGEALVAKFTGTIAGSSNKNTPLTMKDVLYIPELRDNLMSVKKLVKAGVVVIFCGSKAILKKGDVVIATANLRGNLYEIEVDIPVASANLCQSEATNLWHRRLGHLSQQGMKAIVSNNLVDGVDFKADKLPFCDACVQGKLCREPFNGTRPRSSNFRS